jgi:hypothetical protein
MTLVNAVSDVKRSDCSFFLSIAVPYVFSTAKQQHPPQSLIHKHRVGSMIYRYFLIQFQQSPN